MKSDENGLYEVLKQIKPSEFKVRRVLIYQHHCLQWPMMVRESSIYSVLRTVRVHIYKMRLFEMKPISNLREIIKTLLINLKCTKNCIEHIGKILLPNRSGKFFLILSLTFDSKIIFTLVIGSGDCLHCSYRMKCILDIEYHSPNKQKKKNMQNKKINRTSIGYLKSIISCTLLVRQ